MANGTIELTRSGSGILYGQIVWSSSSNGTGANSSSVTASVQLKRSDAGYTTTGTWKGSLKVGSTTQSISYYGSIGGSWVTVGTLTATVSHESNGSGSCYIYSKINGPTETTMEGTYVSGSATVTLDTIARQATLTSATNFTDEEGPTITYNNPLGGAAPALDVGIAMENDSSKTSVWRSVDKTAGTATITLIDAEKTAIRKALTSSNSGTAWIFLRTRIGETLYYSSIAKTVTIKNPNPTISPTITDSNSTTVALTGSSSKLVRFYSNAAITFGAAAVKNATIASKKVTCGGQSLTADGTINGVGSNSFEFTVTDSRGNTAKKTVTPSFVEYVKLSCDLANNMPDTSGNMTVKVTGNYFSGSFGSTSNTLSVYYRYKTAGGSYSAWKSMSAVKSGNTYTATASITGLDYQTNYVFQAYAEDKLATVYSAEKAARSTPVFDWGENDFSFNVPVTIMGNQVRTKRCLVGNTSSSDTNYPWYKFASVTASALNEDLRISFKVTFGYGNTTRFATLNANIRTQNSDGANAITRLEFESDTGVECTNFVLAHSGTGVGAVYELWVKLGAYRHCFFEVLSETSRTGYIDKWTLYNKTSAGSELGPPAAYYKLDSTKPYLLNAWPVGSICIRYDTTSPADLFGGTWVRIEGRMLFGCAASGTVGATGTHTTGSGTSSLPYVNVAVWRRTA